jgi:hypothetical protein
LQRRLNLSTRVAAPPVSLSLQENKAEREKRLQNMLEDSQQLNSIHAAMERNKWY